MPVNDEPSPLNDVAVTIPVTLMPLGKLGAPFAPLFVIVSTRSLPSPPAPGL